MTTLEQFNAYEMVRRSGLTNMYAINTVIALAEELEDVELDRETVKDIMSEYLDYRDIWERHQDAPELWHNDITSPVLA